MKQMITHIIDVHPDFVAGFHQFVTHSQHHGFGFPVVADHHMLSFW